METIIKNKALDIVLVIVGVVLFSTGLFLVKSVSEPQGILRALPYICIGVGCGLFGQGTGSLLSRRALQKDPQMARQIEIDRRDERNLAVGNRAKARAYDMMIFVFGALMLAFALMEVDMVVVLLLVFAYLFVAFSAVYFRAKYEKEM